MRFDLEQFSAQDVIVSLVVLAAQLHREGRADSHSAGTGNGFFRVVTDIAQEDMYVSLRLGSFSKT